MHIKKDRNDSGSYYIRFNDEDRKHETNIEEILESNSSLQIIKTEEIQFKDKLEVKFARLFDSVTDAEVSCRIFSHTVVVEPQDFLVITWTCSVNRHEI